MQQDDLRYLDSEAQQLYMAYQRRFESDDWKELIEWSVEEHTKCVARELVASKWEDVVMCRGERRAYQNIINLETSVTNQFNSLVDRAKELEIAAVEGDNE